MMCPRRIFLSLLLFIASATAGNTDLASVSEDRPYEKESWPEIRNSLVRHLHHKHNHYHHHHHKNHHSKHHHHHKNHQQRHHHHHNHHNRHNYHNHHQNYDNRHNRNYRLGHFRTCNKAPKICHAEGSLGQSCCQNRCVDLMNDNLNCGRCGNRCGFGQTCCGGKCTGIMNDNQNCGRCNNKCSNGRYCTLGMCGYA